MALWVVPMIGAVLLPGLWWTSADRPFAVRPDLVMTMTVFVAVVAVAMLAALSNGFRRRIRWSLGVTASVVIAGFQWRMFTIAGESVADSTGMALAADVIPVLLAGGLLWLTVRLAGDWQFAVLSATAMVVVIGFLGVATLGLMAPAPPKYEANTPRTDDPDVLLLVLDGYGRADWLTDEYGFTNADFLEALEERGFSIATAATPNYGYTFASVGTMLNMDYLFAPGEISDIERTQMRAALTGSTGLLTTFDEAGYETVYIENQWGGSLCGGAIDRCIRDGLVERSLWTLGQMTILAPVARMIQPEAFHTVSTQHLMALGDYVAAPRIDDAPRITFAHLLVPHHPLLLNADCTSRSKDDRTYWSGEGGAALEARRSSYVEQVKCVNSKTLEALDRLIEQNPEAVIMITGDHGPGSRLDVNLDYTDVASAAIDERMKILSAYRLPGCEDTFRIDLTPVNGTRLLANCALGMDLSSLPDENRWIDLDGEGIVLDITDRVGG